MKKKELREKYKAKRKNLSASENENISERITRLLISNFDLHQKNISIFLPITRFNEINTWLIFDKVNANFCLPVIRNNDELEHVLYEGKHQLKLTDWGILEPKNGKIIQPQQIDFVIVPLLTIDEKGFRVGYGKGFYDKFLKKCSPECKFIGLYQFTQIEKISDLHSNDIALHYCITPERIIHF